MSVTNLTSILAPEAVPEYFALEGSRLYRKLASGAVSQLKSRDGNQIVTLFRGVRLLGMEIAWCLIHGNWPEFPIVQLGADPLDFSEGNLYPARIKRLRYVERVAGNLCYHSLSSYGHSTAERCRKNWEELARDFYVKDLAYVLRVEASNRELRQAYLREQAALTYMPPEASPRTARPVRGSRPAAVPGMEWHWWEGVWISVPIACHVADDYRRRIIAWQAGARSFRFDPDSRRVKAYYPDGRECL